MKENTLLKIALICSLIGLAALYFISSKIEVKRYAPKQLKANIGDDVGLKGTITKITDKGSVVFIEVEQANTVAVVLFTKDNISLSKGDNIEIIGEVQEYNGKEEIIAQRVRAVK